MEDYICQVKGSTLFMSCSAVGEYTAACDMTLFPLLAVPIYTTYTADKKLSTYHIIVLMLLINHRVSYCHLQVLGKSCLGKIYQPNSRCFVKTIKYIHLDFGTVANSMKLHKTNTILSSALPAIENRETELSWTCIGTFDVVGCYSFL